MNFKLKLQLWNVFIKPPYDYSASAFWQEKRKTYQRTIQLSYKKSIKVIGNLPMNTTDKFVNSCAKKTNNIYKLNKILIYQRLANRGFSLDLEQQDFEDIKGDQIRVKQLPNNIVQIYKLCMLRCKKHKVRATAKHLIERNLKISEDKLLKLIFSNQGKKKRIQKMERQIEECIQKSNFVQM
ncbi:unnamed protein product (macronuclear) [Paramecium tetraurelia]|uniref:Uncharacterized protein n=1 Tax=Paramecium tetraurelia TaxID=5888 RepID=A0E4S0_PARTE|nr:uncharacterized protein GSPATT00023462001 [Paramecium tetraurelia]CAK90287.1 unnamed protein product [Paramecium tetraurelia]|eukprot:XP_001457684.1 hypothetical protein (macronuclear) [Paramecium tetraurelia strain d4-2]